KKAPATPPRTGATPPYKAASHEDTSSDTASAPCGAGARAGRVRLGHITNSRFTVQSTPPPHRAEPAASPNVAAPPRPDPVGPPRVVEVNGFEPMTSCLQSRRSPS